MNCSVPINVCVLPTKTTNLADFIKELNVQSDTMVFLSENCYSHLKNNSVYIDQKNAKVFRQHDSQNNTKAYIETKNIDSSNCSFLRNIFTNDYIYEYSNGIPSSITMIILEDEIDDFNPSIAASIIECDKDDSPVNCIINNPSKFEDSIVFLSSSGHEKLKKLTNTVSNVYAIERLVWNADNNYPGGNILLNCLNPDSLYIICNMNFPFFTKNFGFNSIPKAIYFIK